MAHVAVEFGHAREIIEHDEALQPDPRRHDAHDVSEAHRLGLVIALDHPADGETRAVAGKSERRVEMIAADIVEIDVDPVGSSGAQALEHRPSLVIDHLIRAERAHEIALLGPAHRRDHGHALRFRDLYDDRSDRARRGGDEDDVAFLR